MAGAEVWISDPILVEAGDNVVGIVYSDQSGSLSVEQSGDGGANWDFSSAAVAVTGAAPATPPAANSGTSFSIPVFGNAVRLVYTNGATPSTIFRIHSKVSSSGARP